MPVSALRTHARPSAVQAQSRRAGGRFTVALLVVYAAVSMLTACIATGDKQSAEELTDVATSSPAAKTIAPPSVSATNVPAVATRPIAPTAATGVNGGGSAHALYLVGLRDFPNPVVLRLQAYFQDHYGIAVTVAPAVPLDDDVIDLDRRQLVAERLIDVVAARIPPHAAGDVFIGLTQYDMMIQAKPEWRFAFSNRDLARNIGVISTARMDPQSFNLRPDDELLFERTAKMVAKSVGVMYLGLAPSNNPKSVMYDNVLSADDLDGMGHEFLP